MRGGRAEGQVHGPGVQLRGEEQPPPARGGVPRRQVRGGAALVDDSLTPLLDVPASGDLAQSWLVSQPGTYQGHGRQLDAASGLAAAQDLYVLGCGRDYRRCLREYVGLAGPMAL